MVDHKIMNAESAKQFIEENDIRNIKLAVTDMDGILRGKYVNKEKFFSALDKRLRVL
jgi:hypothetical protein